MQSWDSLVDVSAITVGAGKELKLYTDKNLTTEFLLDTPITENLKLYAKIADENSLFLFTLANQNDILKAEN